MKKPKSGPKALKGDGAPDATIATGARLPGSLQRMVRRHPLAEAWATMRAYRRWSLRDAAKASGVSASQINRFEAGMDISLSTLDKLLASVQLALAITHRSGVHYSTDTQPPNAEVSDGL